VPRKARLRQVAADIRAVFSPPDRTTVEAHLTFLRSQDRENRFPAGGLDGEKHTRRTDILQLSNRELAHDPHHQQLGAVGTLGAGGVELEDGEYQCANQSI